ncbi:hypothetical protein [Pontibacillus sp. HMF3514]|uniref:hypothetical protein n=1 Tax=Pontibacillus sp. HMF3514 TaxID=2692425 RepID=UPI00131F78EF|nr:hypothetical protein [Pontibacillus sp. HMF3514]QHE51256.1 hypothetical protein GS400_04065 [Pontibacillus sp. HMF3514]
MNQINKTNKWVLGIVWIYAITLAIGYLNGYNLFPITQLIRSIFEPIHISIFGEAT